VVEVVKTIKVSETNWQALEAVRQTILQEKIKAQLGSGKLERTDVTFDEVITKLLKKES
jgi:hypothetical protein